MRKFLIKATFSCFLLQGAFIATSQDDQKNINSNGVKVMGVVKDAKSGEPLPYCNVYLSRSLKGTYTNEDGSFTLNNISQGTYQLVISFVGYKTQTKTINITDKTIDNLDILLSGNVETLETLEVIGERDKEWERMMKKFETSLFGKISFSSQCEIVNPWVVSFDGDKNKFSASAQEAIEIENNALGFKMKMNLNSFYQESLIFQYDGYFQFELLEPRNEKEKSNWESNQNIAYEGSITHFLKSLLNDTWQSEGFILERLEDAKAQNFMGVKSTWIGKGDLNEFIEIQSYREDFRVFIKKPFLISYQNEYFEGNPQTSSIANDQTKAAIFDSTGVLTNPSSLIISGYLVQEGISTLLPTDYKRDTKLFEQQSNLKLAEYNNLFTNYIESKPLSIFIRTDKESYFSGETIWMRAYLIHSISNLPKYDQQIISTQLINSSGEIVTQQKLKCLNGGASSNFVLPDSLDGGAYLIRATLETTDYDENIVFERPVSIADFSETKKEINSTTKPTLYFYPEGGQLIDGVTSRVAFKSNLSNVTGTVYSENGKEITSFDAVHNGMGFFELKPKAGEAYHAKISNHETHHPLPSISERGIALSADRENNNLKLQIKSSNDFPGSSITLLIHSNGQLVHLQKFLLDKSKELVIPITSLRPGINHITLFDIQKRPILERLFYKPLVGDLPIRVHLADSIYSSRNKVEVDIESKINVSDTIHTDLSISVVDLSQANQSVDIKTYFNFIDNTNIQYPSENGDLLSESISNHPDLYMMIYGWKRFEWNEFLSNEFDVPKALTSINVKGNVKRKNGEPMTQTNLSLINMDNGFLTTTITDSTGLFVFEGLDITDTTTLVIKVESNQKLVSQAQLTIDSTHKLKIIPWQDRFNQPVWSLLKSDETELNDVKTLAYERKLLSELEDFTMLNEVVVISEREEKPDPRKATLGKGDHTIRTEDISMESAQNLFDIVDARVPGLRVVTTGMNSNLKYIIIRKPVGFTDIASQAAAILIDNIPIEPSDVGMINPHDIESVEIFTSGKAAAYGARGANGVVAFYTKEGGTSAKEFYDDPLMTKFVYKNAYYTPRDFFTPNYDVLSVRDKYVDSRPTVYWNPNITITNFKNQGFSFFTSDRAVELLIDIQGVTQTGELIHETKLIKVQD